MKKIIAALLVFSLALVGCSSEKISSAQIPEKFKEYYLGIQDQGYYETVYRAYNVQEDGESTSITVNKYHENGMVAYGATYGTDSTSVTATTVAYGSGTHMESYILLNGIGLTYDMTLNTDEYDYSLTSPFERDYLEYQEGKSSYSKGTFTIVFAFSEQYMKIIATKAKGDYFSKIETYIYNDADMKDLVSHSETEYIVKEEPYNLDWDIALAKEAVQSDCSYVITQLADY